MRESAPAQTPVRRGMPPGESRSWLVPLRTRDPCSFSRRCRPVAMLCAGLQSSGVAGRPGSSNRQQTLGGVGIVFQVRGLPQNRAAMKCVGDSATEIYTFDNAYVLSPKPVPA